MEESKTNWKVNNSNLGAHKQTEPIVDFIEADRSRIKVDYRTFISSLACHTCNRKHRNRLRQAEIKIRKELDLVQFVEKQRFFSILALQLLSPSKHFLIKRMRALNAEDLDDDLRERKKLSDSESDKAALRRRGFTAAIKKTLVSSNRDDQRLADLFNVGWTKDKVRRREEKDMEIGHKNNQHPELTDPTSIND